MKISSKVVALVMVLTMLLGLLAGCTGIKDAGKSLTPNSSTPNVEAPVDTDKTPQNESTPEPTSDPTSEGQKITVQASTLGSREVFVADDAEDIVIEYLKAIALEDYDKALSCIYFTDGSILGVEDLKAAILTTDFKNLKGQTITEVTCTAETGTDIKNLAMEITLSDESILKYTVSAIMTKDFVWMVDKADLYIKDWVVKTPADVDIYVNSVKLSNKGKIMDGDRPVYTVPYMTKRKAVISCQSSQFGEYSEEFTATTEQFNFTPEVSDETFAEATAALKDILEGIYVHMEAKDDISTIAEYFVPDMDITQFTVMYTAGVSERGNKTNNTTVVSIVKRTDNNAKCYLRADNVITLNIGAEISWNTKNNKNSSMRLLSWVGMTKIDGTWYLNNVHERLFAWVNGYTRDY